LLKREEKSQATRVLETTPQPKVETSFEAQGTILGIQHRTIGTYWAVIQPSGTLYGEGNGVAMTKDGVLTWKGSGVGRFTERGGISYRGTIYYQTTAEKFLRLNGTATIFEYELDEENNTNTVAYEWK
jgi:hypothetical protein